LTCSALTDYTVHFPLFNTCLTSDCPLLSSGTETPPRTRFRAQASVLGDDIGMRRDPFQPSACEGTLPRRAFLRTGLTGLCSLGLGDPLRIQARALSVNPAAGPSMIVIWLWGGPSHLETFDPKPEAPAEYRGAQCAIATNVPGIQITERLPLLAKVT